ncbi:hypothetical protein CWI38_0362p0010 [Hamiltosporidium tvaerminnensis]|uniref:Uncharacterized protein n=1 Tax=Hamiltosporidium tvaerminnensis TaxID=1176355 RepID=A0A4Q9LY57_9MICR|nr:hypothetical protein CWI38_0362p0010 [Hamiltosporidium tvaerminnensis]
MAGPEPRGESRRLELLGDLNSKVGKERAYTSIIGKESLHRDRSENGPKVRELFGKNIQKNMNSYEESGKSKNKEGIEETWERLNKEHKGRQSWFDEEYKIALHAKPGTKYIVTETNAPEKIYLYKKIEYETRKAGLRINRIKKKMHDDQEEAGKYSAFLSASFKNLRMLLTKDNDNSDISRLFECIFNIRGNTLPSFSYSDSSVSNDLDLLFWRAKKVVRMSRNNWYVIFRLYNEKLCHYLIAMCKKNSTHEAENKKRQKEMQRGPCLLTDNKLYKHQRDVVCTIPKLSENKKENTVLLNVFINKEYGNNCKDPCFAVNKVYDLIDNASVRPLYKTVFCYTQDIHLFCGNEGVCLAATLRTKQ